MGAGGWRCVLGDPWVKEEQAGMHKVMVRLPVSGGVRELSNKEQRWMSC